MDIEGFFDDSRVLLELHLHRPVVFVVKSKDYI